jgi:ATP-binding cassette subfamily F protein uup
MNYLSVENLAKSYGEKVLFNNISFGVEKGQKVALVAKNGAGKTSLLKILIGADIADKGKAAFNQQIRVGFMEQTPVFPDGLTVLQYVFQSESPLFQAVKNYELSLENYQHKGGEKEIVALEKATQRMEELKAWDFETKVKKILSTFLIHDLSQQVQKLSGGQQKRISLARVLIEEPDFLILDEPTNHLDLDMIEWLEEYLMKANLTLLLVTHDRYFLDRICDEILELDGGILYRHKGNYSYYIEQKAIREENEARSIDKAKNLMRREWEWVRKMPKARGTKAKYRMDAFEEIKEKATSGKKEDALQLNIKMSRLGGKILEVSHLNKKFDNQIIVKDFSYVFKRKERIGIVGKNGVGKTSFLEMVTGKLEADSGKIDTGETVVYGYYTQQGMNLSNDKRVIEVIKDIAEFIPMAGGETLSASQLLQRFQFSPEQQYSYISTLSGGEKRRLYLLTILMKNPNFLILDEPTNDLDLMTLNTLEDFLEGFGGCLIIVSHDRYFMDKLTDHLFIFEGDGIISDFNGHYSDFREMLEVKELEKKNEEKLKSAKEKEFTQSNSSSDKKKKLSYKEQKEFDSIQQDIANLEKEKESLSLKLSNGLVTDYKEIQKISESIQQIDNQIENKMLRWMELEEKVNS